MTAIRTPEPGVAAPTWSAASREPAGRPGPRWPWYLLAVGAVVVAAGAVVAARSASTDRTSAEHTLGRTRARLVRQEGALSGMHGRFARAAVGAARAEDARHAADQVVAVTQAGLSDAQVGLHAAQMTQAGQSARLVATRTCLLGARSALDATTAGDSSAAAADLRAVSVSCTQALGRADGDTPVFGFDFADPFVLRTSSGLYAFATNAGAGTVQVLRGSDPQHWALAGNALAGLPGWARRGTTWAPAVLARPGGYVLYYSVRETSTNRQCITTALSPAPAGPYVDSSTAPLECGPAGAIDASPFLAADGTPYLVWKQEPDQIVGQALTPDGRGLTGSRRTLLTPSAGWEGGNVEAPAMLVSGGRYGLLFSANDWNGRSYVQGGASCTGPLGPCGGAAAILSSHGTVAGPGGGSPFQDAFGGWWLAYHAYREPAVGYPNSRFMHVARLALDGSGRPVVIG